MADMVRSRLIWALAILVFFLMLATARTGYLQLARGGHYARMALASDTFSVSLEDFSRGDILDRHGRSLTGAYKANRVLVFPGITENADMVAGELSAVTGLDYDVVRGIFDDFIPVLLPGIIDGGQAEIIGKKGWKGVQVVPYNFRYGPRPLAVHITGQLGKIRDLNELKELNRSGDKCYKLSDWVGREGLEYYYNQALQGMYPAAVAGLYTDALGNDLPGMPVLVDDSIGDFTRANVLTTIDLDIQDTVERVMDRYIKKGAVVVLDTAGGDILAMASRPAYNPSPSAQEKAADLNDERYVNQSLALFQPGSVFKIVVAAAALAEGIAGADDGFVCCGEAHRPVRCWKDEGHGIVTFAEAFAQSCNPVFVEVGRKLGAAKIIQYARAFGLDSQAVAGYPAPADSRQDLNLIAAEYNLVNSSIGQGPVLVTPLQVAAMTNTIAGGGLYMQPGLVKEVVGANGRPVSRNAPADPVRVISPEIAGQIGKMMVAVTRSGVGQKAWVENGGTAGKTGSAQLSGDSRVNAWFSGYGPLDKPQYTVTVLVREGKSGGETAAPVFREIMEELLAKG